MPSSIQTTNADRRSSKHPVPGPRFEGDVARERAIVASGDPSQPRVTREPPEDNGGVGMAPRGAPALAGAEMAVRRPARLVIVEDGALLHDLEPPPEGCEHTVVVVQSRGERPAAFAQRVRRRLRNLEEEQQGVVCAVFLLAPRADAAAQAARVQIGRWLNRHAQMLAMTTSVLALHAPAGAQSWVLELLDAIVLRPGCSALSAHVRFDQPRRAESLSASRAVLDQRGLRLLA
jgi:hypothetical protein